MDENVIKNQRYLEHDLDTLLNSNSLTSFVSFVKLYIRKVVLEFYANLLRSVTDDQSEFYKKVFVRGRWYNFNPTLIRKVLNCYCQNMVELEESLDIIASIITNNVHLTWLDKIRASSLTTVYAALFVITTRNWLPNSQRDAVSKKVAVLIRKVVKMVEFDLSQLVFDEVVRHAKKVHARHFEEPCWM
ncbi:hypothetical protein V6Z11_D04G056800 [Gossypium hirsutum]